MIRSLRRRHFHMTLILCILVPLVFFLALTKRESIPQTANFPAILDPVPAPLTPVWQTNVSQDGFSLNLSTALKASEWTLEVTPEDALAFPDVLVYYTDQPDKPLLEHAMLLGGMAGAERKQFPLPATSFGKQGQLRFYSLAHRRMLLMHDLPAAATTP